MSTVTKKDLIDRIAERTGQRRSDVKDVVQDFLDLVTTELGGGNRLEFRDFGVFEVKERAARVAQNPKTLERVEVPSKLTVKFKAGRLMKQALDGDPAPQHKPAGAPAAGELASLNGHAGKTAERAVEVKTRPVETRTLKRQAEPVR